MASKLENFKSTLENIKDSSGMNVDVDSLVEKVEKNEENIDMESFVLLRLQIDRIVKDYEEFFAKLGRGIEVTIKITKENCADQVGEQWTIGEKGNMIVRRIEQIGTKGKYAPVKAIHSKLDNIDEM